MNNHYRPLPAPAAMCHYQPPRGHEPHGYWIIARCPYCDRPLPQLPHCGGGGPYRLVPDTTDPATVAALGEG